MWKVKLKSIIWRYLQFFTPLYKINRNAFILAKRKFKTVLKNLEKLIRKTLETKKNVDTSSKFVYFVLTDEFRIFTSATHDWNRNPPHPFPQRHLGKPPNTNPFRKNTCPTKSLVCFWRPESQQVRNFYLTCPVRLTKTRLDQRCADP